MNLQDMFKMFGGGQQQQPPTAPQYGTLGSSYSLGDDGASAMTILPRPTSQAEMAQLRQDDQYSPGFGLKKSWLGEKLGGRFDDALAGFAIGAGSWSGGPQALSQGTRLQRERERMIQDQQYQEQAMALRQQQMVQDQERYKQRKLTDGLEIIANSAKITSPAARKLFRQKGFEAFNLDPSGELAKLLEKGDEEEQAAVISAMRQAAQNYGMDGQAIEEAFRLNPSLGMKIFQENVESVKYKKQQETSAAVGRILSDRGESPSGAPESPPAGPQGQAAPQVTPTPLKPSERRSQVETMIDQIAAEEGVDPQILKTIAAIETSGYDSKAVSPVGARGLMQFMPATAKRFGVNPHDDASAIRGAARYVNFLSKKFGGNPDLILAGYNAGEGNVEKHGGVPPFRETRGYVEKGRSILAGLGPRQSAPLVAQDAPSSVQDTEPRLPVAPATPTQGRAPQSDQTVKLEKVDAALAELARKEEALLQLPPDDPAVKRGLATIKTRRAELERQKARYEKQEQRDAEGEKNIGTQGFRAYALGRLPKGTRLNEVDPETLKRLEEEYNSREKGDQVEVQRHQGENAERLRTSKLTDKQREAYELSAAHEGVTLPQDDAEAKKVIAEKKLKPRKEMDEKVVRTMTDRKTTSDVLQELLDNLQDADFGVITGRVQPLMDRWGINTKGVEPRAAYLALLATVRNAVINQLSGTAVGEKEAKRLEQQLADLTQSADVARGKIKAGIAFLKKQQRDDEKVQSSNLRYVPHELRLGEPELGSLFQPGPASLKVDSSKLPTLGGVPPKNAEAVDALRRRLGIGAQQ